MSFKSILENDALISQIREKLTEDTTIANNTIAALENENRQHWETIKTEMEANGLLEDTIEGDYCDYVIYTTTGRESVKVENPDAVPDEFCKLERKPKLTEIKKHIQEGNQVNWACIERGEGKLTYKIKKKG